MSQESGTLAAPLITKVLMVDDRKENLLALEFLLQSEHTQIFKAYSGRDALELLLEHRFALALLDVQMPEINGFELAELMRGSELTKEIPIIFVTAGAIDAKHTFRGYEAGAVDFLYKPLDPRIVKSKVEVFLRMEEQRLQIQTQMAQLQTAIKAREDFLSIASHELRTPLTSLSLQLQLARRSIKLEEGIIPAPEKIVKTLELASRQVSKLARLTDDLLDISRIHAGKLSVIKANVDLAALVREVIERLRPQLDQAGCSLGLELTEPMIVPCEAFRFEQVLTNLISNVIKYAPGTPITVKLQRANNHAVLTVSDRGHGIPEDKLETIFDRFERVDAPIGVSGLGLGLYIVKQIMIAHGGDIHATSTVGQGTTFTGTLPIN